MNESELKKLIADTHWKVMEVVTKELGITISEYMKNKSASFIAGAITVMAEQKHK